MIPLYLSLAAFSCLSFAGAEPFHVPLMRRREPLSIEDYVNAGNALRIKYGYVNSPSKRQNTATIPIVDQVIHSPPCESLPPPLTTIYRTATPATWVLSRLGRRAFSALILLVVLAQLSNSPQTFKVVLVTGDANLWISSPSCAACSPDAPDFNSDASDTLEIAHNSTGQPVRVTLSYGSNSVAGEIVRDTVAMGGFQVKLQPWLRVDQSSPNFVHDSTSGILGLARLSPTLRLLHSGRHLPTAVDWGHPK